MRWRGTARQSSRQRDRVGHGQVAAVQGHLAIGVADLATQVPAVDLDQLQRRQAPHPQKWRRLRLPRVLGELLRNLDECLLKDVRIIHPPRYPAAEPQLDHPLQPAPIGRKERAMASWSPAAAR